MTGAEIIDAVMNYTYNISASDGDNTARRARVLYYLQNTFDETWLMREWAFSFKETTVTIDTNGVGVLPTDYLELGVQGGVYDALGEKMRERPFVEIRQFTLQGLTQNPPINFAIVSNGALLEIRTPVIGNSYTVNLQYRYQPPALEDDALDPTTIPPIPLAHHQTVLVNGTVSKAASSLGDPRPEFENAYRQAQQRMIIVERSRKTSIQKLPRALSMW